MAQKKPEKLDYLVQCARALHTSPIFYGIVARVLGAALGFAGMGMVLYAMQSMDLSSEGADSFVKGEVFLFGLWGVMAVGGSVLMAFSYWSMKAALETVHRFNEIKQVLIANADVLKGVDALKLDDIAPPPPTAEQKYMKRFSSRDLSWGWWLLVVGMFVIGVLLMAASFATLNYPDFDSFVRQYVGKPGNLAVAGLFLMLGAGNVMVLRGRRLAKLAEKAENAKKGIDTEDASAECSSGQGGEDVRRSGSGGWWKDGDEGR